MYVENTMERLGTPQEDTGEKTGCPPGEGPPVLWTADAINLVELLYACHELKLFNNGEISLKDLTAHVCQTFGVETMPGCAGGKATTAPISSTGSGKSCCGRWTRTTRGNTGGTNKPMPAC